MSNGQVFEIQREIYCHSVMIYPLKCKMCNKKETYIGETIGDHTEGFKVRISQYMSYCKTGVST